MTTPEIETPIITDLKRKSETQGGQNKSQKALFPRGTVLRRAIDHNIPHMPKLFHECIVVDEEKQIVVHVPAADFSLGSLLASQSIKVKRDPLDIFEDRKDVIVKDIENSFEKEKIAKNAESWEGEIWKYHPIVSNCETFTNLCSNGMPSSEQSVGVVSLMLVAAGFLPPEKHMSQEEVDKYLVQIPEM